MGTIWYLVDDANRQAFDLDKSGHWWDDRSSPELPAYWKPLFLEAARWAEGREVRLMNEHDEDAYPWLSDDGACDYSFGSGWTMTSMWAAPCCMCGQMHETKP